MTALAVAAATIVAGLVTSQPPQPAAAADWTAPTFERAMGGRGEAGVYAWGIEYNPVSNEILVGDYWNYQVRRYSMTGEHLGDFFRETSLRKGQPYTIPVDPRNGDVYVAELADGRPRGYFARYSKEGTYLGEIRVDGGYPVWAHIDATGVLWVADAHNDSSPTILRYQLTNGAATRLNSFGSYGTTINSGKVGRELHGIDTDADGNAYIADAANRTIHVFRPDGQWLRDIGSSGTGQGQFTGDLRGVSVDRATQRLYVVDAAGSQIDVFALDGTPLDSFGTEGFGPGQFADGGREVAIDAQGNLWTADYGGYRFHQFRPDGSLVGTYPDPASPPPPGGFSQVRDVAVDPVDGAVWGADSWNNRFQKFAADGTLLGAWGYRNSRPPYGMDYPRGIAVNPDNRDVWVSNTRDHIIRVYDVDGNYRFTVGSGLDSSGTGSFRWVMDVEFHEGKAYVSDYTSGYWKVLDASTGGELTRVSRRNSGIAVDAATGWIYVSSWADKRVYVYDENRSYRYSFGSTGSGTGQFSNPWGIDVVDGTVWVTDANRNMLMAFTTGGQFLGEVGGKGDGAGKFLNPSGLTHDAAGNLYVADAGNNRVVVYSTTVGGPAEDLAPPTGTVTAPVTGSTVPAQAPVVVSGAYADDVRIVKAEVALRDRGTGRYWNANLATWGTKKVWNLAGGSGTPTSGTYRFNFVAPEYGHTYVAQVRFVDAAGRTSVAPIVQTVFTTAGRPADVAPPRVDFAAPTMDEQVAAGVVTVRGWVTDDRAVGGVSLAVRDRVAGLWWDPETGTWGQAPVWSAATLSATAGMGSAFTWTFAGAQPGGDYYLEAAATDAAGNVDPSKPFRRFTAG